MKTVIVLAVLVSSLIMSRAEVMSPIPLWPNGAPGALGTRSQDIPTLTPYLPDPTNTTGAAMVICPGGGYEHLAPHEGSDYALWLNQHGITCFVLEISTGLGRVSLSGGISGRDPRDALDARARGGLQN